MTILIAGAGLAGARCAETLRSLGWAGRIMLVGDEPHGPYERPALSKDFLAGSRARILLRPAAFWAEHEIELVTGRRVHSLDAVGRTARVGEEVVRWDRLVIATGARARRLHGPTGVHHLRTLDDACALGADIRPGTRLVVVGAGFIGAEVASTLRPMVGSVTMIDPLAAPLVRILGAEVGRLLADRYRAHGVDLRLNVGVDGFIGTDRVRAVRLRSGELLRADVVVVGIGSVPAGLDGGAVDTDSAGRTPLPGVYACGDVAAWNRPSIGRVRVEHWTSAAGQGRAVAHAIVGDPVPFDEAPYFWSDQFGLRLQHVGHATAWHAVELDGDADAFVARYVDEHGRLLAALSANRPAETASLRRELAAA
jgi:3-phenylpropionate/trans-cinnamate dioxygenase ferredoxin reductase component